MGVRHRRHSPSSRRRSERLTVNKPLHYSFSLLFIVLFTATISYVSEFTTEAQDNTHMLTVNMMPVDYNHIDPIEWLDMVTAAPPNCTTRVRITLASRSLWTLQAFDETNKTSTTLPKDFYIYYTSNHETSVAHVDNPLNNNVYQLYFVERDYESAVSNQTHSQNGGTLTVHHRCQDHRIKWKQYNLTIAPPVRPRQPLQVNLSPFSLVVFLEDHLIRQPQTTSDKVFYSDADQEDMDQIGLSQTTVSKALKLLEDDDLVAVVLSAPSATISNSTLHIEQCELSVETAQLRFPHATVYWILPFATHPYKMKANMTVMNHRQDEINLMNELEIPIIDLYEPTFLFADASIDGIQYDADFQRRILLPSLFQDEAIYHAEIYNAFDRDMYD